MKQQTPMQLARKAVRLYSCDLVPKQTNRHNQIQWLRAIEMLGDKWLLAKSIPKEVTQ